MAKPIWQVADQPVVQKQVIFFHPDLGIGGAERLIVDAAVGLQDLGHKVIIYTSHCDPQHCFEEARDGTLEVRVRGNTLFPPVLFNRFHILLAILRQLHLVISVGLLSDELWQLKPDVFIVDQLSACVPLLRWIFPNKQRTLFYCHFPDQLLVQKTEKGILKLIKKLYRYPFDWFEGWSTNGSDAIVVNSNFTRSVAEKTFLNLTTKLDVIYPCVDDVQRVSTGEEEILWAGKHKILLSINRFERKKNIGLALRAYKALKTHERESVRLVIAGGYDARISENVKYHQELVSEAESRGLKHATAKTVPTALAIPAEIEVLFLLSVPGSFKETLLRNAHLLLYTPSNEHFGIVPVEAMQHGVPVLASNTGGPLETIVDGETGWLRDVAKESEWTGVIREALTGLSPAQRQTMSERGKQRVRDHFTRSTMARAFDQSMDSMMKSRRSAFIERNDIILGLGLVGAVLAALTATVFHAAFPTNSQRRAGNFATIPRT